VEIVVIDAVVVGAGPNGLAAAIALAQRGLEVTVLEAADEIGGGTRTRELIVPGVRHDVCSAVHPLGLISPFLRSLDLERHGLTWRWPEIDLAHPLDGGRAGVMVRSLDDTAAGLGRDGKAWRRLFEPIARSLDDLAEDVFTPLLQRPKHPFALGRFGLRAVQPATILARRWRDEEARALFAGVAAHPLQPLERPLTSAVAVMMIAAAHHVGWPVAERGSQSITTAMAARLNELGGNIHTGVRVTSLAQLPRSRVVLLDVAPGAAADIAGDRMPARVRRAYRRWRHGPAAFKVDLVVRDGIPWTNDACRKAGTVHCGGTLEQIAAAERDVQHGRMPARPFVLVSQQYLADPSRSKGDLHPIWAYAHVPHGFTGDATDATIGQIERFAPGLRERIIGTSVWRPADFERYNANYVGGDIATGANDPVQFVIRPRLALDPYATGVPGVFLCSAATPPGAGAHGMCGFNAAQSALRYLERS
jgi:phytoene dehydrogenase-like protein